VKSIKDIRDIEYYDPRTYVDYLKLGDVNTKPFLMIAELIDNSISSFEKKYGNNWKEKLIIKIKMKFKGQETEIHGYKTIKGSYISFSDNGFGMNKSELKNAVKLNAINQSTSKMNVHGRGLKQCAFFFGVDLTIRTSTGNQYLYIEQKLSDQESEHSPYFIEVKEDTESSRGTEILIENIREDKAISINVWKRIKETLEFRYIKYLEKGNLEICYDFNDEELGRFDIPKEPVIFVNQAFECTNETQDKFDNFLKNILKRVKEEIKHRASNIYQETTLETYEKISNLFRDSRENNQLEFKFDLEFNIQGNILPIQFWMLPQKHGKYRGIRLFEGERAINHAGYQELETKPYIDWKKGVMETGSTENRFAGQCDLSLLGIKSKTDKSSFTISEKMRDELDKRIFSVWVAFNEFIIRSRKEIKNKPGHKPSPPEIRALESIINRKFKGENVKLISSDSKKDEVVLEFESINNNLWTIKIIIDDTARPKDIFSKDVNEDDNELTMTVFTAHLFWNKMHILNKDFYAEAVVPITLLISFQYIDLLENFNGDSIDIINFEGAKFQNE